MKMHTKSIYTYLPGILRTVLILLFLTILVLPAISAVNESLPEIDNSSEIDSLNKVLDSHPEPGIAIPILGRLISMHMHSPEVIPFWKRQLELGQQLDSASVVYSSLKGLARYYYNLGLRDSLLYWADQVELVASKRKEYPNELFDVKSYSCQDLLWSKNYEVALNTAMDVYRLASQVKHTYGLVRCSENLGLIYRAIRRDSDAVVAFQEGLDLVETIGGNLETELRMTACQAECCLRTTDFRSVEKILERYEVLIKKQQALNEKKGQLYPVEREYLLLYSFLTELYLRENNLDQAKKSLAKAVEYEGKELSEEDFAGRIYLFAQTGYNKKVGNIPQALYYVDKLLAKDSKPEGPLLKAEILKSIGKLEEALVLYDEIYEYNMEKNSETFLRQINQLRTLHEISNQEIQAQELKIGNQRMQRKEQQLIFSSVVVIVLLILLYTLFAFFRRTRKLKNELQHEKDSLLESENELMKEKVKAEEASRMKSAFIANMSHEIRTPLNAIVGFSGLLIDESAIPEEKQDYASIIKNNTDLMLNLVNDVLDLSRMETGDLNFTFRSYALADCCKNALESIRCRVPKGVELTYTPAMDSVTIYTDALRLQQLLTNLLTNATKFTQKGEINLSYELIDNGRNVRIAITDTGYGVPPEKQADIFKRFEKLDDYKPGAGLGLSICSLITEHLKGSIFIDSTYTTGARFVFIHPCEMPGETYSRETEETD